MDAKSFGTMAWTAFLKTLLLVFNLVFFTIGLAFFIIGIYGIKVFKDFFSFAHGNTIYIPFISIGLFMMVVGILSLWCTPKGISWLLYLYGVIVFLLFVSILAISVLFVVKRDAIETPLKSAITNAMEIYPEKAESIDLLQSTIKCCGSENYTDWFLTKWANNRKSVPISCCKNQTSCENLDISQSNPVDIYQQGCFRKFFDSIENNYALISGVGFASAIIILGGSIISCALASNLNKNRYEQVA